MASSEAGMNPAELMNIAQNERDHWWYRGMRSILRGIVRRHLRQKIEGRVLEAGCGTGYTSRWLRSEYGWNLFPIDLETVALRHVLSFQVPNATQGDIRCLPFQDASFDLVLSLDVLIHLARGDETKCMGEFFRVTAPGGLLLLRVAAFDSLRSRHSEFIEEKQRFTRGRLMRAVRQSGFRVLACTYANSLLFPVAIAKFRIWEPLLHKPPATGVEAVPGWLNALLYQALALEAKWIGCGRRLPIGQSLILIGEKPVS